MSEKTEEATPSRVRKAREDGDVAKSAEFTGVGVMAGASAVLTVSAAEVFTRMLALLRETIALVAQPAPDVNLAGRLVEQGATVMGWAIAPALGVALALALLLNYVQVGALFTLKPVIPDLSRMNPAQGIKNIVSKDKVVELIKNMLKIALMAAVARSLFIDAWPLIIRLGRLELGAAMAALGREVRYIWWVMLGAMLASAIADLFWQRHKHRKKLMMSKDEIQREFKESEGDPMLKGQREQFRHELMSDPGVRRVKDADAVVVNPTHVAVALRYQHEEMSAPQVIASGRGEVARQIREAARRHDIPIVREVALARALVELDHDQDIPEELFEATAEVLRFVHSLAQRD